jgi:hypothetical protein
MIIPEVILQRVIIQGYRNLRKDQRLLDALFRNLTQVQLASVKDFILNASVQFNVNFPKQDLKVPALTLVLKNENETVTFLGDVMTTIHTPDPDQVYDTLGGHGASVSQQGGLPRKLAGPLSVIESNGSTLTLDEDASTIVESLIEDPIGAAYLYVVSGTGVGQVLPVQSIQADELTVVGTFNPELDNTSLVDIRVADKSDLAMGEPSRVYDAEGFYQRKGAQYESTYHLHIMAGQQDEVIYLYSVIKALLMSQRATLEGQGIISLKISGSDFSPRSEYLPSEVFQRMMVLTFTYPFSFIEELEVASEIGVNVTGYDQSGEVLCETLTSTITL